MRYYWCVNCGYSHDFGKDRKRGLNCVNCDYEEVTELDEDEWQEDYERILTRNKHVLGDGRIFVGEKFKKSGQEIDDILKSIKEGTYVNSNG